MSRRSPLEPLPVGPTRAALVSALERAMQPSGETLAPALLYPPWRHADALRPDRPLVVSTSGTGKSVWWNALQDPRTRARLSRVIRSDVSTSWDVRAGFGLFRDDGLTRDDIDALLANGVPPRAIWQTIVAWQTWGTESNSPLRALPDWGSRVGWVTHQASNASHRLRQFDADLRARGALSLVVFDSLRNVASKALDRDRLLVALLELVAELGALRAVRLKVFLRPEMLVGLRGLHDASRLLWAKADLPWSERDLYGLLWHLLGNAPSGAEAFRKESSAELATGESWIEDDGVWFQPRELAASETAQRALFRRLAGARMVAKTRAETPYDWLLGHLADAKGRIAPRVFISALLEACRPLSEDDTYALPPEAIAHGVRQAAQDSANILFAEHAGLDEVMRYARTNFLPIPRERLLGTFGFAAVKARLRPEHVGDHYRKEDLLADLEDLGIFETTPGGQMNMPEFFRIGFGFKLKGGVPPEAR